MIHQSSFLAMPEDLFNRYECSWSVMNIHVPQYPYTFFLFQKHIFIEMADDNGPVRKRVLAELPLTVVGVEGLFRDKFQVTPNTNLRINIYDPHAGFYEWEGDIDPELAVFIFQAVVLSE